jgi:cobalt-zinc-cadmium efflux system outer membrane protein
MRLVIARFLVASLAAFASASLAVGAAAQNRGFAEPTGTLTLARAIEAALAGNPDLAVTAFDLKAADARITQAGLRINPELSAELEDFAGTDSVRGIDSLQTTLTLSQVIELGDKRAQRTNVASIDRELFGVERQAQQLDVLAEVVRRFIAVVAIQAEVALTQRATALAQDTVTVIAERVRAARSPQAEQSRATIALTRARIEQEQAKSALRGARHALAALWGSYAPAFSEANADLFELAPSAPFEMLTERLRRNPDFLRFATQARLRDAELRLAQAQARADVNVSLGLRRFEATDDFGLVAGVSVPIRRFNRNQGAIREAEVRVGQVGAETQAALVAAEATLFGLYEELLSAKARSEALRSEAVIQAQAALAQTRDGYERGRFSYLELAAAQEELLDLERASIEAAAEYHRLQAEIERLTGESITTSIP